LLHIIASSAGFIAHLHPNPHANVGAQQEPMSKSCSVFVGNLPYDADEQELKEVLSKAGEVSSVRIVSDRDTQQPKGYAFCDFMDKSSVETAIEKLNNVEYNGRRLRIDRSERELHRSHGALEDRRDGKGGGGHGKGGEAPVPMEQIPMAPPMTSVADRLARIREHEAADQARVAAVEHAELAEIARLVETMTPQQLFSILAEMQRLSLRAPDVARALVTENVQLCLALQHAQYLVGLAEEPPLPTDPEVRERARNVREKVFGIAPADASMGVPPGPPMGHQMPVGPGLMGFPGLTAPMAPGFPGASPAGLAQLTAFAAALAGTGGLTAPAPMHPMPAMPNLGAAPGDVGQKELLEKLTKLSPAQIDQLPHQTKLAVLGFLQTLPAQAA